MSRGFRSGTWVQFAKATIALSALYRLLLLNPQRGCSILSGLHEWERSRRLTDTWAADMPCRASLGELGWEGCADEDILLTNCGLKPPSPRSPPRRNQTPPPPKPTKPKKCPGGKRKSFESSSSSSSDHARGEGEAAPSIAVAAAKAARGTPRFGGG